MSYFGSIYSDAGLPHRARAVYMYLHNRADAKKQCWPSIQTISRELALSVSTVKRAIEDLKKAGYLQTEQRWRDNGGKSSLLFTLLR